MTEELNKEVRTLKMQIAKLQLESKLRRNLASELDKQKQIAKNAEELANEKSKENYKHLTNKIFSGFKSRCKIPFS